MEKFIHVLPVIILIESWLASIPLAIAGKWGSAMYWFSAGLLNFSVIFLIKKMG
jgi:hypothetical protein